MKRTLQLRCTCGQCYLYALHLAISKALLILYVAVYGIVKLYIDLNEFDNHPCNLIGKVLTKRKELRMFCLHNYFV